LAEETLGAAVEKAEEEVGRRQQHVSRLGWRQRMMTPRSLLRECRLFGGCSTAAAAD
jgi:hypothetical protein